MKNMELLVLSLEYIECHLGEDMKTIDIANACHCSKSTLEKMFQCVYSISVHGYIVRRRMMKAARRIAEDSKESILSIAVEYGYSSHEAFARAFKEIWNCNPSEFRERKYTELFPKFTMPVSEGDNYMGTRKSVDISELYDLFKARRDCYFVCCDIKHLGPINEISHKAGDLAILETMRRMEAVVSDDDMVFRIGGDEFCILTSSTDEKYAQDILDAIHTYDGQTYLYEEQQIPLTLHAAVAKFQGTQLRYNDLFAELHIAIRESKQE